METRVPIRSMLGTSKILLHTKYKSCEPHGLREEEFFFHIFLLYDYGRWWPPECGQFRPRGMIGRIYVEYHLTLLHTKYKSFRPCGFREEDF